MKGGRPGLLLPAVLFLAGCQTVSEDDGVAARIVAPDDASRAALQQAVNAALGQEVLLASDALVNSDQLIIERRPPTGAAGRLATGRNMEMPVHFELRLAAGRCVLVDSRNRSARVLDNTHCMPL